ncbi:uncharacterized protein LOC101892199 isoform X2 [Musca domestica]|uniref:Uncharacterized protein LOC101892199 isoform X2 n=1 Tax=Musca domestica TaxID=7370 RepID=A0A9J7CIZ4_MUSDO|nr:uncharacterized protein LOC101892199 isoform X2 [Musca domestica]
MKFNGALKPRHGASIEGSSPGAGQLRKHRVKQYPQDICGNAQSESLPQQQQRYPHHHLHHPFGDIECGVKSEEINTTSISSKDNRFKNLLSKERQHQQAQHLGKHPDEQGMGNDAARMRPQIFTQPSRITSVTVAQKLTSFMGSGSRGTVAWRQASGALGGGGSHEIHAVIIPKQKQQLIITTRQEKEHGNNRNNNNSDIQRTNSPNNENTKRPKAIATSRPSRTATNPVTNNFDDDDNNKNKKLKASSKLLEICDWRALPFPSVIFSRLFEQFALLLLWFGLLMPTTGNTVSGNGSGIRNGHSASRVTKYNRIAKIMRIPQSLMASLKRICFKNAFQSRLPLTTTAITTAPTKSCALTYLLLSCAVAAVLLPQQVLADDGDNFFSPNGIVIGETTTEFDYASRGQKKFGDKCDNTLECGFPGSICDTKKKSCQCTEDLPVTNHFDKCGKEAAVNESCFFNEQCEVKYFQTECRDGRCVCRFDMTPIWLKDGSVECKGRQDKKGPETYIDPAMIGVLIGMALMFIIICVVLRLFSQARWRENRTIFNTPNPRLMNVSLLRESKLLHGQERRGSRMSVRAPSRQPSMASLRPHSPNPSLGRMTRSKSNTRSSDSRVSDASNCSRLLEHSHTANTHHHIAHPHPNSSNITAAAGHATPHTSGIHSASVSPHSSNAISPTPTPTLTATIAYSSQSPTTGTACSTNIKPPPPTVNIKPNKF